MVLYWLYLPWLRCLVVFVVLVIFTMVTVSSGVCCTGYIYHGYGAYGGVVLVIFTMVTVSSGVCCTGYIYHGYGA